MRILDADTDDSGFICYYHKGGGWKGHQQIELDVEWYKWLRYKSKIEKERVNRIKSKSPENITHEDVDFLERQKQLSKFKKFFDEYFLKDNHEPEIARVVIGSREHPELLEQIMIDKLTEEELLEAKDKLLNYKNPEEFDKLGKIVNDFENNYESLSYVDAFVYHYLAEYYYYHSFRRSIQSSNESFHQRARVYAKALQDRDANICSSSL